MITPKQFETISHSIQRHWKEITLTTWKLAPHCDGAVEVRMGETRLLVTAVMWRTPKPDQSRFPLAIDYRESYYAAGKIWWGRYRKIEGRPSEESVLYARLVDRCLRPMFPKGMINDVVITISPLSLDQEHSPGELAILGASTALLLWWIPFWWPVSGVRVGYQDTYVIGATNSEIQAWIMDLHAAGTASEINMLEAWGEQTPINIVSKGFEIAQTAIEELCTFQEEFLAKCDITPLKITTSKLSQDQLDEIETVISPAMFKKLFGVPKHEFDAAFEAFKTQAREALITNESSWSTNMVDEWVFQLLKKAIRKQTLQEWKRVDGRDSRQIRQIHAETNVVPRVHGTGLFRRWDTQVLSLLTLGSPADAEIKDDMEHDDIATRYMHHYKMPPFSNNEARMIRGQNRREIGHGRLAQKALEPVLPTESDFPYTMRIVSEVLWSGWSTSMASVCGSTLALMSWWVPITAPVSGIAMGLIKEWDEYVILTDIKWTEDFVWDMDFKLAGSSQGMTAIQMDTKLTGLDVPTLQEMLEHAQDGREHILAYMKTIVPKNATSLSQYAPLLMTFKVKADQVKEVIGKWWSTINAIIEKTGVKIDLQDDGSWIITADNQENWKTAMDMIMQAIWSPTVGDSITWKITRVEKYGVFVDLWKRKVGLCHAKQLGEWFIDPTQLYKVWESLAVTVTWIDAQWKIQLWKAS